MSIFLIRYVHESLFGAGLEVFEQEKKVNDKDANIILDKVKAYILESFDQEKQYFTYDDDKKKWKLKIGNKSVSVNTNNEVVSIWRLNFEFDDNLEVLRSEYDWMLQEKINNLPAASLKL